jgi:hypothetical protein
MFLLKYFVTLSFNLLFLFADFITEMFLFSRLLHIIHSRPIRIFSVTSWLFVFENSTRLLLTFMCSYASFSWQSTNQDTTVVWLGLKLRQVYPSQWIIIIFCERIFIIIYNGHVRLRSKCAYFSFKEPNMHNLKNHK